MLEVTNTEGKGVKKLYDYQENDLSRIFERFDKRPPNYNLLYQLPTGGGKTVIFSEISRRYIAEKKKKVLILTHRIELCAQTSRMLTGFGVHNKIINSQVKELEKDDDHQCFVAMVETLNNRLNDEVIDLKDLGLVIIDEAHFNSFRKLFKHFEECFILGVTATPLSSNRKLPMRDSYKELITGLSIQDLVTKGFLSKATTYTYDVKLGSLKIGINGDYTVRSSDLLYSNYSMQNKLLQAYEDKSKGKKTLIFNNGINTSQHVYQTFKEAGYDVRHLDNTHNPAERNEILTWFKNKPDAILTSVSILTTGFDEPTVETIILNRATKSLTLYHQMIGRGSRVLPNKDTFQVVDLGNNIARFGLWTAPINWQRIFKDPDSFLESMITDMEIERYFKYKLPPEVREKFSKTEDVSFDVKKESEKVKLENLRPAVVIERAVEQHIKMCVENSDDLLEAFSLMRMLDDDIADRVRRYCYYICKSTNNYKNWLIDEYKSKLKKGIMNNY